MGDALLTAMLVACCAAQNVMKLGHNKRAALDMEERKKPGIV